VRVAVTVAPGETRIEERPDPVCGAGEVVCRVLACATCGSDVHGSYVTRKLPAVLGHEPAGEVVSVGAGVTSVVEGERVAIHHHVPCGECRRCRQGHETLCDGFRATALDPGGFAEYVRVPALNVAHATFAIPAHLSDEAASFVEPLACCLRAVRRAAVQPGDTAVVVGLGSIGHLFVALFRLAGASVIAVDAASARVAFAERRGVSAVGPDRASGLVDKLSDGRGADVVLITGGGTRVLEWAVRVVRDGGGIHYFAGGSGEALPVPLETFYHRELTLTSTYSSSPADLAEAFRLIAAGALDLEGLYTHRLALDRLGEGVELMRTQGAVKVYVTP
jgi:L-iditol 2-dehydrogenase